MLFMMPMMTVSSVHQRTGNLNDPIQMNEQKRADRQGEGGRDRAGRRASDVRLVTRDKRDEFANRKLAQQIAEQDVKEKRPEIREEPIGVFLQRRAEYFDAKEFQYRFEEVLAAGRRFALRPAE